LTRGEAMTSVSAASLIEGLVVDWMAMHPETPIKADYASVGGARVPGEPALRQALWSLLENAGEASAWGIELRARVEQGGLIVEVLDRGRGFTPDQLKQLGQLIRSRKGAGHGVGLFLAVNVARRLGGALSATNRPEGGAIVRLSLPLVGSEQAA
jgi:two-component system sensor histidine kinase RegB